MTAAQTKKDLPALKNLPESITGAMVALAVEAPTNFDVPWLRHATSWPTLSEDDNQLLCSLRTERKRLKSSMDNHRKGSRLEQCHAYKKLLYGLATWTCMWRERLVQRITNEVDEDLTTGLGLICRGVSVVTNAKVRLQDMPLVPGVAPAPAAEVEATPGADSVVATSEAETVVAAS